ncbi:two-component system OmpR family response regulator [Xanthomonas sacchari]|uniref:winged helix-turn-helix domain-containing protein n=1 Tax=Xanthomonas sacchari TaxID=56458 RepID=UPI0027897219|nr:response regulator transcription factor [Xanthomonas sacchari]MDQ1092568.1 two-component system OmpR family response regulator [Xanthomonas sacchari]
MLSDNRWLAKILVADADPALRDRIRDYLACFNLQAHDADSAPHLQAQLAAGHYDAVVLDAGLDGAEGLRLCRHLRDRGDIAIVMMADRAEPVDRVIGLDLGADDFLVRPPDLRELVARLNAVLRRVRAPQPPLAAHGGWQVDAARHQAVAPDGRTIPLSPGELRLMAVFLEQPGEVLTRETLRAALGDGETSASAGSRGIDLQVSRLRQKLGDDPLVPQWIRTVRGKGYVFELQRMGLPATR